MRGQEFNVRFSVKRSSFVFMHEAIQLAAEGLVDLRTVMPGLMLPVAGGRRVLSLLPPPPPPPPSPPRDLSEEAASRRNAIMLDAVAAGKAADDRAASSLLQGGSAAGGSLSGGAQVQGSPAASRGLSVRVPGLSWANQSLDAQQRLAVERIIDGRYAPRPFMVFGPPGTGKTRYDEEIGTVDSCTARGYCPYGAAPPVSASTCFSFYTTRHAHCPTL